MRKKQCITPIEVFGSRVYLVISKMKRSKGDVQTGFIFKAENRRTEGVIPPHSEILWDSDKEVSSKDFFTVTTLQKISNQESTNVNHQISYYNRCYEWQWCPWLLCKEGIVVENKKKLNVFCCHADVEDFFNIFTKLVGRYMKSNCKKKKHFYDSVHNTKIVFFLYRRYNINFYYLF